MLYTHYTGSIDHNHYLHLHLNKTMHHEIHKKKNGKGSRGRNGTQLQEIA